MLVDATAEDSIFSFVDGSNSYNQVKTVLAQGFLVVQSLFDDNKHTNVITIFNHLNTGVIIKSICLMMIVNIF